MSKVLTKEYLTDVDSPWLSEFTGIDDDAAEYLSKQEDSLYLGGLTELSDAAAESLSKHRCHSLTRIGSNN